MKNSKIILNLPLLDSIRLKRVRLSVICKFFNHTQCEQITTLLLKRTYLRISKLYLNLKKRFRKKKILFGL